MTRQLSILIVDDHPLFREGVKSLIDRAPGFIVAAEAGTAGEAIRVALELRPDLILLDLSLPDSNGLNLLGELRSQLPDAAVIVLSMHSRIEMVAESFRCGARGYIVKESASERLVQALDCVARGEQYLDSTISPQVIRRLTDFAVKKAKRTESSYDALTRREQQILRLLAEGQYPKTIAQSLFITRKTVENHRANIMTKLGLKTPLELMRYAMRKGLVEVDDPFRDA